MCGIAGSLDMYGSRDERELVARMTDTLSHRGPDDAGMLVDPPVTLGHRRLSIIDLSEAGHQPMSTRDGRLWITYNGEIYNYRELAEELETLGYEFRTASDTEVLLAAYQEWRSDSLSRLNGMFAFAIWDRERRELFCARDRFGVKPFYYLHIDSSFRFASEIKALLIDPRVIREPNYRTVTDFLAYGITDHTEETFFQDVFQLPPGSFLIVRPNREIPRPTKWYELHRGNPVEQPEATLLSLLRDSVALRLRSDVPVATALSGGLDSSTVTVLATEALGRENLSPVPAFTARSFDPKIDEWPFAEPTLAITGAESRAFFPREDTLIQNLDHLLWHLDEPFHSAALYGHWAMSALARESGVRVMLDGQGGDEALGGYGYIVYPGVWRTSISRGALGYVAREVHNRRITQGVSPVASAKELVKTLLPRIARPVKKPSWLRTAPERAPTPRGGLFGHLAFGIRVQPLPMYNRLLDRSTMAVALEARNPFLDYRVVEFGLALCPADVVSGGVTKAVLRRAMLGLLPEPVIYRGVKQGFTTDEAHWMRGALGDVMRDSFQSAPDRPYFDRTALLDLLEQHRGGAAREFPLWRAFITERWLRLFIDPPRLPRPRSSQFTPATRASALDKIAQPDRLAEEVGQRHST